MDPEQGSDERGSSPARAWGGDASQDLVGQPSPKTPYLPQVKTWENETPQRTQGSELICTRIVEITPDYERVRRDRLLRDNLEQSLRDRTGRDIPVLRVPQRALLPPLAGKLPQVCISEASTRAPSAGAPLTARTTDTFKEAGDAAEVAVRPESPAQVPVVGQLAPLVLPPRGRGRDHSRRCHGQNRPCPPPDTQVASAQRIGVVRPDSPAPHHRGRSRNRSGTENPQGRHSQDLDSTVHFPRERLPALAPASSANQAHAEERRERPPRMEKRRERTSSRPPRRLGLVC